MITFITGGARSGKSSYAQKEALQRSGNPVYVATAKRYEGDAEFAARISRHQQERDGRWTNYEELLHVSNLPLDNKVVVVDCVTLWLTNFFSLHKTDVDAALTAFREEINLLAGLNARLFIISNEIGMGVHAETEIGRRFTDLQGWANQHLAQQANEVILMISGIPVTIKQQHAV